MLKKRNKKEGVGLTSQKIMREKLGLNKIPFITIKPKHNNLINRIKNKISYSGTLILKLKRAVEFYTNLKNYRGVRHTACLPVRGQRSHTNAKTRKKLKKKLIKKDLTKKKGKNKKDLRRKKTK